MNDRRDRWFLFYNRVSNIWAGFFTRVTELTCTQGQSWQIGLLIKLSKTMHNIYVHVAHCSIWIANCPFTLLFELIIIRQWRCISIISDIQLASISNFGVPDDGLFSVFIPTVICLWTQFKLHYNIILKIHYYAQKLEIMSECLLIKTMLTRKAVCQVNNVR